MLAREDAGVDHADDLPGKKYGDKYKPDEEERCFLRAHRYSGEAKAVGIVEFVKTMIESKCCAHIFRQSEILDLCTTSTLAGFH